MNPLGSNGDRQTRLGREIDNAYEQAIARVDARSRAERTSAAASPGKGAAPDQTVFELRPAPNGEPHQLPLEDVLGNSLGVEGHLGIAGLLEPGTVEDRWLCLSLLRLLGLLVEPVVAVIDAPDQTEAQDQPCDE